MLEREKRIEIEREKVVEESKLSMFYKLNYRRDRMIMYNNFSKMFGNELFFGISKNNYIFPSSALRSLIYFSKVKYLSIVKGESISDTLFIFSTFEPDHDFYTSLYDENGKMYLCLPFGDSVNICDFYNSKRLFISFDGGGGYCFENEISKPSELMFNDNIELRFIIKS